MPGGYQLGARHGYADGGNGGANRACVRPPSAICPGVRATRCYSGQCVVQCLCCVAKRDGHPTHTPCRHAVFPVVCVAVQPVRIRMGQLQAVESACVSMYLSPRYARHQRPSALVDEQVVLAAELAAVGGIGAGKLSAEGGMARWPSRSWRVPIESARTSGSINTVIKLRSKPKARTISSASNTSSTSIQHWTIFCHLPTN